MADAFPAPPASIGVRLRTETPADAAFTSALYAAGRAAEIAAAGWPAALADAFLRDQHRLQTMHFATANPAADRLIIERSGTPVGRMYVDRSARRWWLLEIGLMPAAQRNGIGGALVAWLIDAARAAGAQSLDLHVARDNARAAALYQRLGFVPAASRHATHDHLRAVLRPLQAV